jgi:hypothetical protein
MAKSSLLDVMMRRCREMNRSLLCVRAVVVGLAARSVTDAIILSGAASAVTAAACIVQAIRVLLMPIAPARSHNSQLSLLLAVCLSMQCHHHLRASLEAISQALSCNSQIYNLSLQLLLLLSLISLHCHRHHH